MKQGRAFDALMSQKPRASLRYRRFISVKWESIFSSDECSSVSASLIIYLVGIVNGVTLIGKCFIFLLSFDRLYLPPYSMYLIEATVEY